MLMKSTNQNKIAQFIVTGIAAGRFKNCIQLQIGQPTNWDANYRLRCEKGSLQYSHPPRLLDQEDLDYDELSCPENCHFFRDVKLEQKQKNDRNEWHEKTKRYERRKTEIKWWLELMGTPFSGFAKLPWQSQLLIFLILAGIFAPRILEAVKTFISIIVK
jgi:hypothetical protein